MSSKNDPTLDEMLEGALGDLLGSGWIDSPAPAPAPEAKKSDPAPPPVAVKPHTYPPLPVRTSTTYEHPPVHPLGPPIDVIAPDDEPEDEDGPGRVIDLGLLTDIATGRKTPLEAANAAGVTMADMQSQLATALHEMDPKEIAKAMGIQAAEQQLKSGALYGAVLYELTQDVLSGRMKPETKIELAKLLAKNGGIEPKDQKGVVSGNGFVLNINMGLAPPQPITIVAD